MTEFLTNLHTRILNHQSCFDALVACIPSRYYLPIEHDPDTLAGKFSHNKKHKAPKQSVKEATKKAKKQKLDPELPKTVPELQKESIKSIEEEMEEDEEIIEEKIEGLEPMQHSNAIELRQKLQARIQQLKSSRGVKSRQELLEKRKHKKDHRQSLSKKGKKSQDDLKGMHIEKVSKAIVEEKPEERLMFGKVEFGEDIKKKLIDPMARLKKAQQKQQRLEELKSVDETKAKAIEESELWHKLIKQADGEKVKDNVTLLKKTVKRKQTEKSKSLREWKDREVGVKKQQDFKQRKRDENIKARVESKKKGKRPGFEGRKK